MLKSFQPENIQPAASINNQLSDYEFRAITPAYSSPQHFSMGAVRGPWTPAGIYEVNGREFLQDRWHWPSANTQIVTAPQQPVDKGTFDALLQNGHGVYNQGPIVGIVHQYSGSAPTTGIYTGYYSGNGEYEGCG